FRLSRLHSVPMSSLSSLHTLSLLDALPIFLTDAGDHGRGLDDVDIGSNGGRRDTNVVPVLILDGNPVIVIEFAIVIQVEHGVIQGRHSTRLNHSHVKSSYGVVGLKKE